NMPSAEHKRLRASLCDLHATGRGVSFFYLSIILRTVRPPTRRLAGNQLLQPLSPSHYGQVITRQLAGWSLSSLLGAPAGITCTAIVSAWSVPSFRSRCTSPQPRSVKLSPA